MFLKISKQVTFLHNNDISFASGKVLSGTFMSQSTSNSYHFPPIFYITRISTLYNLNSWFHFSISLYHITY